MIKKINYDVYVLKLVGVMGISNVFNIKDLTLYHNNATSSNTPRAYLPPPSYLKEGSEHVANHQIASTIESGDQNI